MSLTLLQRLVALAAVALLAGVGALTLSDHSDGEPAAAADEAVAAPDGSWYTALAGSRGAARDAERTTCRLILRDRSLGVTHPLLPCGALIYIEYGGTELLTEVIDTKVKQPGRQFELTELLAQRLGLEGTQEIRWAYAQRG